jgi:polyisoprenoid-binding protein YceI
VRSEDLNAVLIDFRRGYFLNESFEFSVAYLLAGVFKMKFSALFGAALIGLSSFGLVSTSAFAKEEVAKLDTSKSVVKWVGSKITGDKHNGTVKVKGGEVTFTEGNPTKGTVTIDMKTIANEDLKDASYNAKLVGHLSSDDFFDVAKFPEATLNLKKITSTGKGTFKVEGDMTIKGKTNPVTMDAKLVSADKGAQQVNVAFKFDRTLWDVRYGSGKFFKNLGDKMISDEIAIDVDVYVQSASFKTASK